MREKDEQLFNAIAMPQPCKFDLFFFLLFFATSANYSRILLPFTLLVACLNSDFSIF